GPGRAARSRDRRRGGRRRQRRGRHYGAAGAALLQLPQDVDLCGLQRDPAQHHGQDDAGPVGNETREATDMDFELSDEQRQLADSLERLLGQQYGIEQRRAIVRSDEGASPAMWGRFAELGILSLPVSEAAGGFGGGAVDLMRPMALIGEALVVEPVLAQL